MKCPVPPQKLQVDPDTPAGRGAAFLGLPLLWSIADLNISLKFAIATVRASIFIVVASGCGAVGAGPEHVRVAKCVVGCAAEVCV